MLLHTILGLEEIENIYLVENSYANQKDILLTLEFLGAIQDSPKADPIIKILDREEIIGLAVFNPGSVEAPEFWAVLTNAVSKGGSQSPNSRKFQELAEEICGSAGQLEARRTTLKDFTEALIEYYSLSLVSRQLCEGCAQVKETYDMVYVRSRVARLKEFIRNLSIGGDILEICCGNGMSTLALYELGYRPLATDYDKCQICQGLEHRVLDPRKTIVLDAAKLSRFFSPGTFDWVVGFMLGTIYPFNRENWACMMAEAVKVLKPGGSLLFTVNKKEEIEVLRESLDALGVVGGIINNRGDGGIYDQWAYLGQAA